MENKEVQVWLSAGTLKQGYPDMAVKLTKPLSKGTYVLAEMPDGRNEVLLLTEVSYKIPFDVEGIPVVLRKATLKEIREFEKKLEIEEKGREFCLQFAKELGLEMKLVRVDCFFDRSKIIFFYTADGRIDFRQLVKELARALRMRIEMRQIGVRNETALLGGIGYCGKEFCCAKFLKSFVPLSIKFAKEQGLILDPNKISGPCGRLLCCLSYEMEVYREFLDNLPKLGSKIKINEESYRVVKYHLFQKLVYLETKDGQLITVPVEDLKSYIVEHTEDFIPEGQLKTLEEEEA
ncbi:regulatory iron-sulfur-containing complex subunit RicT [Thermodesulfobacterium sp. TA1]|uniref:PSP1 domain-containing protein n=1 Tax=Thermodesulfobacterium sp. TA1 TaxID=2234087 RepID=UPI00197EE2EE|nr:regulatory iron-sulfur-containing complex subunit RicT [Thermodesulfobacterium sp. TA1]